MQINRAMSQGLRDFVASPTRARVNLVGGSVLAATALIATIQAWSPFAGVFFITGVIMLSEGLLRVLSMEENVNAPQRMLSMIEGARMRIVATSGSLHHSHWVDWEDGRIVEALEERLRHGVRVDIVTGPIDPVTRDRINPLLTAFAQFQVWEIHDDPSPHGLLIDNRELRVERPHTQDSPHRANAYIHKPSAAAAMFLATFERHKRRAALIK